MTAGLVPEIVVVSILPEAVDLAKQNRAVEPDLRRGEPSACSLNRREFSSPRYPNSDGFSRCVNMQSFTS